MNNFRKAGLLIVTLVIPALIFTFLRFFATNHYQVPFYFPQKTVSGEVIVSNGDTLYYKVIPKHLKSLNGDTLPEDVFRHGLTIVNYIPEVCDDSCKMVLDQLGRIIRLRENISGLSVLSIMTERKNAAVDVGNLVGKEGWSVALFSEDSRKEVLLQMLKLETKVPKFDSDVSERKLVLIDKNANIRGYYMGTDSDEVDRLMAEIKILDYEENNSK